MSLHAFKKPTFSLEEKIWERGIKNIAGVDEVGRGSFAGPLVAASVILPLNISAKDEINDSKLLSSKMREKLSKIIMSEALAYGIGICSVEHINRYGIVNSTQFAFRRALKALKIVPDFILIDAFFISGVNKKKQLPVIHGDRVSISIAAASIIAKVYRDSIMVKLNNKFPQYGFCTNKGYGTKSHILCIKKHGLTKLHRTCFNIQKYC